MLKTLSTAVLAWYVVSVGAAALLYAFVTRDKKGRRW